MTVTIACPPDSGLAAAAELAEPLRQGLASDSVVVIDAGCVMAADLGFVQLIESARITAAARGRTLRLAAPAGPALRGVLEASGLLSGASAADLAFWFHEGDAA